ncbi:MAG: NADH-quinone oxidoreductase subunit L [Verrucomicrobia bacterium]|nr:NADH-quinone oxidoreductase subunit L [Verrucomicrobiota bacterium]
MTLEALPWLILFLPLLAAVAITLFFQKDEERSANFSIGAVWIGFALSAALLFFTAGKAPLETAVNWLDVGGLKADIGLRVDSLSLLMLLVVTGVGGLIHIYSRGYMHGDAGFSRFFASLSLFTFSMLGIVLANNLLMMFIFWELVGVSSYLLIGFWFEKPSAADAAKKAFLTNRIGDFGFLLGIILVWATLGSLHFGELETALKNNPQALGALATTAGLLLFCGAVGKSAQFPRHVGLPDAMEGPTPVSALIHAATMVAAGVFMLCRIFFILNVPGSMALEVIAWIGGFTALLAALMAVQQNDIKRILAYSTLSQLGYMVMAIGLTAPGAAMFHLTTHAFFKALLFLGAGSVIHTLHHEQDIWRMGGLKTKLPVTYLTFLIGTLALCGVWPLSGFYSKDSILAAAAEHNIALFILGVTVAALTTFYMARLFLVAFLGPAKSDAAEHAHESPSVMTVPLRLLAVPSAIAGFFGLEAFLEKFFHPAEAGHATSFLETIFAPFNHSPLAAFFGLFAVLLGGSCAFSLYWNATRDVLPEKIGLLSRAMRNRFYFDELYEWFIARIQEALATFTDAFDRWIVMGLVRLTHGSVELTGRALRLLQTGNLQTYTFLFAAGVVALLYFVLH